MGSLFSWVFFSALIIGMIAFDLGLFTRTNQTITIKRSLIWLGTSVGLALAFCVYIYLNLGLTKALNFLSGYVIEKALSLDNLLVFIAIFHTFNLSLKDQHRVLKWGILGAIILRGIFIVLGTALLAKFHWMIYLFGLFLIITSIKMAQPTKRPLDITRTRFYRLCQKILPISHTPHGQAFFVYTHGKFSVTPLFLALLSIEFVDIIFAIDSIPAIFAITLDPFIVYTSNIFAILGLRSLYFLIVQTTQRFKYLSGALAYVLGFAGIKILIQGFIEISPFVSLAIILGIIGFSILFSLKKQK